MIAQYVPLENAHTHIRLFHPAAALRQMCDPCEKEGKRDLNGQASILTIMDASLVRHVLKVTAIWSCSLFAVVSFVRWIKERSDGPRDRYDQIKLEEPTPAKARQKLPRTEENRIALNTVRFLSAIRANDARLAWDLCTLRASAGKRMEMDFSPNGIGKTKENPLVLWALTLMDRETSEHVFKTMLNCGASEWLNRSMDAEGRPIDQCTRSAAHILLKYHEKLRIDLMPTQTHSPLYHMIDQSCSPDDCIKMIQYMMTANPAFLDWADPETQTTALYICCKRSAQSPNMHDVVVELLATGHVNPNHECFERKPITEPPFIVDSLECARADVVENRSVVRPWIRVPLSFLPVPLLKLVEDYYCF